MFRFPSIVLCFVAFFVVFIDVSISYKEEDYCQEGWQEAEDGQYQVQISSTLWEIHSVLHKGNHHSGKICRLSGLKGHFIPSCFEGRGWDKLLSDLPGVCEPLIKEFYANARLREHEINYWIQGHEFTIDVDDIDEVLGIDNLDDHDFTHYKDRMLSIETV